MMVAYPTLQPLERERIGRAVALAANGTHVEFRCERINGDAWRLIYVAGKTTEEVLTAPNQAVFIRMWGLVESYYKSEVARAQKEQAAKAGRVDQAGKAAKEEAEGRAAGTGEHSGVGVAEHSVSPVPAVRGVLRGVRTTATDRVRSDARAGQRNVEQRGRQRRNTGVS